MPDPHSQCSGIYYACPLGLKMQCAEMLKFDVTSEECLEDEYVAACGGTPTQKPPLVIAPPSEPVGKLNAVKLDYWQYQQIMRRLHAEHGRHFFHLL